jgi:hypothetical protein
VKFTCAQHELESATEPDEMAVKDLFAEILGEHPEVNRSMAEKLTALTVTYPCEEGAIHSWATARLT